MGWNDTRAEPEGIQFDIGFANGLIGSFLVDNELVSDQVGGHHYLKSLIFTENPSDFAANRRIDSGFFIGTSAPIEDR